jgi:predicted amino acid dehydrogenase
MITILGAGGVTANEVVKLLSAREHPFRLVTRNAPHGNREEQTNGRATDCGQHLGPLRTETAVCRRRKLCGYTSF